MEYDAIVIGAGVVGPCVATALARQGKTVMIVERDWSEPKDRVVGELMQPAGLKALRELGMIQAVNGIGAVPVTGYYIKFGQDSVQIDYPAKLDVDASVRPVPCCVSNGNDKMRTDDKALDAAEWDADPHVRGVALQHGKFLMNLRAIVRAEKNVTAVEGTATAVVRDEHALDLVRGVRVKLADGLVETYHAKTTFACDGIYSKFRREHAADYVPKIGSYFVALALHGCKLPAPGRGHVILGDHAPVLAYQVSSDETRMLCAHRGARPPSASNDDFFDYLRRDVAPNLPEGMRASFDECVASRKFRALPNQYLSAERQAKNRGFIMIGDLLNMRHPLTGGGMTVGLNDTVLLMRLLQGVDLGDHSEVRARLLQFHAQRKKLDAVVNTLLIALYLLFAADRAGLRVLQDGCFKYFQLGGDCVRGPIGLLLGMLPYPMLLFSHFFSVAFYGVYCNFVRRGVSGFLLAMWEAIDALFSAVMLFTPYLWRELV